MNFYVRLKKTANVLLPPPVVRESARLWESLASLLFKGNQRYCPICESNLRCFMPTGSPRRSNALCPVCQSKERHRLVWLFFQKKTNLFDDEPKKMLHFAPELAMELRFRREKQLEYITADLSNPRATINLDITDTKLEDETFSAIYCSHVLEHVPDDRKALKELYRILKDNGWAVFQVPIFPEPTFEDLSITDPQERIKMFGQADHVRRCGLDYGDRIKDAGFIVDTYSASDLVQDKQKLMRQGISEEQVIFFCKKISTNSPEHR